MKIIKMQQNSEEWLEYRKGKSGGSGFDDLYVLGLPNKTKMIEKLEADGQKLTPADKRGSAATLAAMLTPQERAEIKLEGEKKKRYYEIIAERVARPITPNDYAEQLNGQPFSMMARGHILEPEAAAAYEKRYVVKLDEDSVVWESEDCAGSYISPDRAKTDGDGICRHALEIKCPESWRVVKMCLEGDWDRDEYMGQVLKYFIDNEHLKELDLAIFTDAIPGLELQVFTIKRSDLAEEIIEAKAFEDAIMPLIDRDAARIAELGF